MKIKIIFACINILESQSGGVKGLCFGIETDFGKGLLVAVNNLFLQEVKVDVRD